ncbi:MAG: efflux RND transporter periplasmic adaptor subunit [Puniceicoccaceae bacterium]
MAACCAALVLPAAPATGESAAPVEVARPETVSGEPSFAFTGTITARRTAALSPRLPGLVLEADADVGHVAKAGDVLVQLDPTLARIELRRAEADLEAVRADLDDAQRRLDEAVQLGDSNFPRSERESRATALRLAEVAVSRMKAILEDRRERVERHKVPAPFDGIVARKRAEMGEWVETGDPVIDLVGREHLRLDVRVPQERIAIARRTDRVTIRLPGLPDAETEGRVSAVAPSVDPGTRSLLVRVRIEDPPDGVKPGMSAVAVFRPEADGETLTIPRDAIIRSAMGETYVWRVEEADGGPRARRGEVALGSTRGDRIDVLRGLGADDRVVVRGNESLEEDQLVRIVESAPAAGEEESD